MYRVLPNWALGSAMALRLRKGLTPMLGETKGCLAPQATYFGHEKCLINVQLKDFDNEKFIGFLSTRACLFAPFESFNFAALTITRRTGVWVAYAREMLVHTLGCHGGSINSVNR